MRILDSYARESARGDRRNLSITGQHAANLRRIEALGAEVGEQLDDKGRSAWVKGVRRPAWERIIARLESGQSNGVVIFDLERFLRTVQDAMRIVELAQAGFAIYDSDMEYDLTTASGQKAFYEAAVAGQYYSHRLSDRVRRGNLQKAMRGEGRAGRYRGWCFEKALLIDDEGNEIKTVVQRPDEVPYAREAVRRRLAGEKWDSIVQWLNDSGQRTGRGALWTTAGLRAALMAPRMAGYIKKNRQSDQIIGYLPGEPVIDPVDWQELLKQIEGNRGRPPKGKCLCSGIVRCAACGGKLICQANKRDKSRRTYICRYKPDGQSLNPCGKTIASEESLDTVVSDWFLMRCTESGETAEALRRGARRRNEARRPHENEVRRLESLRDYWDKKLLDGGCSIERHKAMIQELESRLKDEYAELDKIGDAPTPGELEVQEIAAKWVEAKGDVTQRRRLLETVLSAGRGTVLLVHPGSALDTPDEVRARFEVAVNGSDDDDD